MANLIIKPSAGGDLVIKSSDSSDAITVGTTGQTTFAENATMSGVTTLADATITAGTFPSGHIINVHNVQGPSGTQTVSDSSNYEGTTIGWTGAVSSKASKLLAVMELRMMCVQANTNNTKAGRFAIYERSSGSSLSLITMGTDVSGGTLRNPSQYQHYRSGHNEEAGNETRQSITWMVTDCTGNTYWALELCAQGTNGTIYIESVISTATIYEIT